MIARLEGMLVEKKPEGVVLDVHGVGYEVRVPLSTFFELPDEGTAEAAHVVRTAVAEGVRLSCSLGVATCKVVAKVACRSNMPS